VPSHRPNTIDLSKYSSVICKLHFAFLFRLVLFDIHKSEMPAFLYGNFVYSYDARKKHLLPLQDARILVFWNQCSWCICVCAQKIMFVMYACCYPEGDVCGAHVLLCWKQCLRFTRAALLKSVFVMYECLYAESSVCVARVLICWNQCLWDSLVSIFL
jgi:hypothetical protein